MVDPWPKKPIVAALASLIAAVDFEAIYIANESEDPEIQRRARILLDCAATARRTVAEDMHRWTVGRYSKTLARLREHEEKEGGGA